MSPLGGSDPQRESAEDWRDRDEPVVGGTSRSTNILVIVGVFAALAVALFLLLESRRNQESALLVTPIANPTAVASLPPPALDIPKPPPPPAPEPAVVVPTSAPVVAPPVATPMPDQTLGFRAPAVVVDLQSAIGTRGASSATAPSGTSAAAGPMSGKPVGAPSGEAVTGVAPGLAGAAATGPAAAAGSTEQFAAHASDTVAEPAVAMQLTNLSTTITQGATIPGILETALNSDLPGYTRAVVSRDVRAFDGKAVLIPRGSRLIGQYRNALSLGQSRVFVIWTRVIRPDGVSIQIGSPGGDALGRGGLTGDVNSHFFARFGGAILLSVLSTGTAAVAGTPSTQVTIGSPAAAVGAAAGATVPAVSDIPPTIAVMQGAAITIFVARDLDFSGVKPIE